MAFVANMRLRGAAFPRNTISFKAHFEQPLDKALSQPVVIGHGNPKDMVLSSAEHDRLIASDRRVVALADCSEHETAA